MFILPVVRGHLSWETTKFNGRFMQVSLYYDVLEAMDTKGHAQLCAFGDTFLGPLLLTWIHFNSSLNK